MADGSPQVIFRLEPQHFELLAKRASKPGGAGTNQVAKQIVIEALHGDARLDDLTIQVADTQRALKALREDFATALEVLLLAVHHPDKTATPDAVRAWVTKNLRQG